MITKKDIVKQTLRHCKTSEIPYHMKFSKLINSRLQEHFGVDDVGEAVGNYIASFSLKHGGNFKQEIQADGSYYDEFGCLWQGTDANVGQIRDRQLKEPSLSNYEFPDAGDPARVVGLQDVIDKNQDKYIVVSIENHTLIERAFNLRGMTEFMIDIYDHSEFAEKLLDNILEYAWGISRQLLEFNIDAVKINDDWGYQQGVMLGVDVWRKLIKPRIVSLCKRIKKKREVDIFLHSDGNITDIMPDIIEVGITAIDPMQPEVMDIFKFKKLYGDKVTFIGGMNTQQTMPFGSPDDVVKEVRNLVKKLGQNGGYILTPGIIVQEDVPMENILAFIDMCQKQAF